jgi:hypothetical protein
VRARTVVPASKFDFGLSNGTTDSNAVRAIAGEGQAQRSIARSIVQRQRTNILGRAGGTTVIPPDDAHSGCKRANG